MKKLWVFVLLFAVGTMSFAQRTERRVINSSGSARTYNTGAAAQGGDNYFNRSKRGANYFNVSLIGSFSDMVNNMFHSSAALSGAWVYAFEKYVFIELGITYQVVSPTFNDTYVTAGLGFQATRYYQPEIVVESQFIGGYNVHIALRNNIMIPSGPVMTRLFIDIGGAYLESAAGDQPTDKSWTYYIGLGVGLLI